MTVAGLLLAAGAGRRFGGPKALVRLAGRTLVDSGTTRLAAAGCAPVAVVLGAAAAQVQAVADLRDVLVVVNPDWDSGMGSSLRCGLAALPPEVPATVVALVDQPLVGPAVVGRLVQAWQAGAVAAVATYDGVPRNPVLLDRAVWPEVSVRAVGDVGARDWLRDNRDRVTAVPCEDVGSPLDIDTPADLAGLEGRTPTCS